MSHEPLQQGLKETWSPTGGLASFQSRPTPQRLQPFPVPFHALPAPSSVLVAWWASWSQGLGSNKGPPASARAAPLAKSSPNEREDGGAGSSPGPGARPSAAGDGRRPAVPALNVAAEQTRSAADVVDEKPGPGSQCSHSCSQRVGTALPTSAGKALLVQRPQG